MTQCCEKKETPKLIPPEFLFADLLWPVEKKSCRRDKLWGFLLTVYDLLK
jgi:hypothetical protein